MRFGNAAWGFRETPLKEQFEYTKEMGLSILEIGIANAGTQGEISLDISDDKLQEIMKLAKEYQVDMLAAATGCDFTVGSEDIAKIKQVIEICRKMNIPYLRIFTGFTQLNNVTSGIFDQMVKSLCEVCEYAKEHNVIPVIETHGAVNGYDDGVEHIMSTSTDIATFQKILNLLPDNVKVCFDPANLYAVGIKEPEKFYVAIKDKVAYAHFKDFAILPSGHLKQSYCGDSDMNWINILDAMKDFDGFCVFEYEIVTNIKEGLKKCLENITKLL